jgi:hypothetical protein
MVKEFLQIIKINTKYLDYGKILSQNLHHLISLKIQMYKEYILKTSSKEKEKLYTKTTDFMKDK